MDGGYDKQIHENNKKFRWSGQILWKKVLKNRCKEIEKKNTRYWSIKGIECINNKIKPFLSRKLRPRWRH